MRQNLGQHFLIDSSVAEKIVQVLRITSSMPVIELGSGHGELTALLLRACETHDARLITIEKDKKFTPELERIAHDFPATQVDFVWEDLRDALPRTVSSLSGAPYVLVGNIPYYLTGQLLRIVEELPQRPTRAVFLVQKEVAVRAAAEPPRMNKLAAALRYWCVPRVLFAVSKRAFAPPPQVESAVLLLETSTNKLVRDIKESAQYYRALSILFAHPRKTIANNLREHVKRIPPPAPNSRDETSAPLDACGISPHARPQNLGVEEIFCIASRLF